jgi:capsular polysaccharide biosynthesis protein
MKPSESWEVRSPTELTARPIGFQDALYFVRSHFLTLILSIVLGLLAGLAAQKLMTPAYVARGKFVVDQLPFTQLATGGDAETDRELVQTLVVSLSSREMRKAVETQLKIPAGRIAFLDSDLPLKLKGPEPRANVSIRSVRNSRIGTIEAVSQDPEFAATVVNTILNELHPYNLLGGRLRNLQLSLDLNKLKADSLTGQLVEAGARRILLEQENAALDEYLKRGLPLPSFPTFAQDATLNNLRTQLILVQSEYDRTASTSTRGERLLGRKAEVEGLQAQLSALAQNLAVGLRSQFETSKIREQNTQAALTSTKDAIDHLRQEAARLSQSFGDPALMRTLASEIGHENGTTANVFVIVDRAAPIYKAVSPKWWLNLFLGVALGGALGMGIALLRTVLDTRVRYAAQVEKQTGCPCLAVLPSRGSRPGKGNPLGIPKQTEYAVGLAYLRSLVLNSIPPGHGILGFSPTHNDTTTSDLVADLAILLASEGKKVLLIDLHLSRPRVPTRFGLTIQKGLGEFLTSDEPVDSFIVPTSLARLHTLSAKPGDHEAANALSCRPMAPVLEGLQSQWDFVFLDAPCIREDWGLLLSLPPKYPLLLTAEYNRTKVTDIVSTLYQTKGQHWNLLGLILLNSRPKF